MGFAKKTAWSCWALLIVYILLTYCWHYLFLHVVHTREGRVMSLWCPVFSLSDITPHVRSFHTCSNTSVFWHCWWMKSYLYLKSFKLMAHDLTAYKQGYISVWNCIPLKKCPSKTRATHIILHHSLLAMPVLWRYDADSDRLTDASTLGRYEPSDSESSTECPVCALCFCQSVSVKQSACYSNI